MKILIAILVCFSISAFAATDKKSECDQSDMEKIVHDYIAHIKKSKSITVIKAETAKTFTIRTVGKDKTFESFLMVEWKMTPDKPVTKALTTVVASVKDGKCVTDLPFYTVDMEPVK